MINLDELLKQQPDYLTLADSSSILPDYAGYSLANLPHSICNWLGIAGIGEQNLAASYPLLTQKYDQVILLVVDGLGWLRLQHWMQTSPDGFDIWNRLFQQDRLAPLTSISPSTTCAALTTLNTGISPAAHGNLAYELWLKEFGVVANMILHAPMSFRGESGSLVKGGFQPADFLPAPTLDTYLVSKGISVEALHPAAIAHSSLTTMLFPAAKLRGYHSLSDLWYRLSEAIQKKKPQPTYLFAYWSDIDELSHLYGPDDLRVQKAFQDFTRYLVELIDNTPRSRGRKTLLLITADHGLQSTPQNETNDLNHHPEFLDLLTIIPTGENRLPFLHIKPGKEAQIADYLRTNWAGKFQAFPAMEVLQSGLFGSKTIYKKTADRLGDLLVVPQDDAYWWWSPKENWLRGRHGGLSRHEMLVPLAFMEF